MIKVIGDFMQPKHIFKAKNAKAEIPKVSAKVAKLLLDKDPEPIVRELAPEPEKTPEPEKPKRTYTRKPKQEADHAGPSPEG